MLWWECGNCFETRHSLNIAKENCVELLSPKGLAVSFCNGIGNLETVASVVGVDRAAAAVTYEALERVHVTKVCFRSILLFSNYLNLGYSLVIWQNNFGRYSHKVDRMEL